MERKRKYYLFQQCLPAWTRNLISLKKHLPRALLLVNPSPKRLRNYHPTQMKAAKRSRNRVQQEKVKDRVKFAAKESSKSKSKGKVDEDDTPLEAPKKWKDYSVEFHFPEPTELTPPLLQLIEVSFSYPSRQDFRLSDVDMGIDMGTRVAIVGPNGAGKSTMLNLLAGDLVSTKGEVRRSQKLRIGRYSQHFVDLPNNGLNTCSVSSTSPPRPRGTQQAGSRPCKSWENLDFPIITISLPLLSLSGRQKSRVLFTSISMSKPHILLDMHSIDALADALDEFSGGVVLVSHDFRLISRVCDDEERSLIWVVEDVTVRNFPESFEEYKEELQREIKAEVDD